MKFFQYVSDAKVNMMFAQIPEGITKRICAELRVDVKVISVTLTPKSPAETRYGKCAAVEKYLRDHHSSDVGDLDRPGRYFGGLGDMRWTVIDEMLVWMGVHGQTLFVMTGSVHHLTGGPPQQLRFYSSMPGAALPELARAVAAALADPDDPEAGSLPASGAAGMDPLEAIETVGSSMRSAATQQVEFFAVNHGTYDVAWPLPDFFQQTPSPTGTTDVDKVVLGSPLYTAHA